MTNPPTFVQTTTGPFTVAYLGHSSAEDFDNDAGRAGTCVETADLAIAWRDTHPEFHRKFTPILEELSDVACPVDKKATEARRKAAKPENKLKVKPVYVSFVTFANKAKATVLAREGGEQLWADIEQKALEFSKTLRISSAPVIRETPIVSADLRKAEAWLAGDDPDFVETKISQYSEYVGGFEVERDDDNRPKAESLSRLITKFLNKRREEAFNAD